MSKIAINKTSVEAVANAALQFLQLTGVRASVQMAALVASSYENPAKAFETHKSFFNTHCITNPDTKLYKDVLFAAMQEQSLTRSVDWKEAPEEVIGQLFDLLAPNEHVVLAAYDESIREEDIYPDVVLRECSKLLTTSLGKRILVWDFGADEYRFFVVPVIHTAALMRCAATLDITLELPEEDEALYVEDNTAIADSEPSSPPVEATETLEDQIEDSSKRGRTGCFIILVVLLAVCYAGYSMLGWAVDFLGRFFQ